MNKVYFIRRDILIYKTSLFNSLIEPVFKSFGDVSPKKERKKFLVLYVLNKIYSLNVSMENIIFSNDVFLSIYIYRYVYELYIKIFYIFSAQSDDEIIERINKFFENKIPDIKTCVDKLDKSLVPNQIIKDHKEKYNKMCNFVHPNINSLHLHINTNSEKQFEFLIPNINLSIWLLVDLMRFFIKQKLIPSEIDQEKLFNIQKITI